VRHSTRWKSGKETIARTRTILMTGARDRHATNIVEHHELIARTLVDWAGIVGARMWCGGAIVHGRTGACRKLARTKLAALAEEAVLDDEKPCGMTRQTFVSRTVSAPAAVREGSKGRRQATGP